MTFEEKRQRQIAITKANPPTKEKNRQDNQRRRDRLRKLRELAKTLPAQEYWLIMRKITSNPL